MDNLYGKTWELLDKIRREAPLVHNITNFVVMQVTANGLLALGASPIMAHAHEEMREITGISSALCLNIGTLSPDWVRSMLLARDVAVEKSLPVVIDPVGAGASAYRTNTALELLKGAHKPVIRGNASEINALAGNAEKTKGVDSCLDSSLSYGVAKELALKHEAVVCVTGPSDLITDGREVITLTGGSPLMPRVTGMGCTASAFCAAFCAVAGQDERLYAVAAAMMVMSAAGGMAAGKAGGPGSFLPLFMDAVYGLEAEDLKRNVCSTL